MNISPSKQLNIFMQNGSENDYRCLEENKQFLSKLVSIESIKVLEAHEEPPLSATALVGELEILVPMAGLIDKEAELARLDKEIEKMEKETGRLKGKLSNAKFVDKAPKDVVEKERTRLSETEISLSKIAEQRQKIAAL